jgi:hypothetical protein
MMKKFALLLIPVLLLTGCKKDEEESGEAQILDFSLVSTSITDFSLEEIFIDDEFSKILVLAQNDLAGENPPISFTPEITISDGASIVPASGEEVSFTNKDGAVTYTVTAANGEEIKWNFTIRDMQLPNAGFEDWFDTLGVDGNPYPEPGLTAESTIWGTANMGTSMFGVYGTTQLADGDNTLVKIVTGETRTVPITSGTIFTGTFDIEAVLANPTDPDQGTEFGIPFTFRPTAIKFKYKFTPGETLIDGTLIDPDNILGGFTIDTLEGTDEFSFWSDLEVRNGDTIQNIGRAELESSETVEDLTEITISYVYSSNEKPTHMSVVFASSTAGGDFKGAVGSTLIIDDVELIYE